MTPVTQRALENIMGKAENDGYQHFLLFPQSFKSIMEQRINACKQHFFHFATILSMTYFFISFIFNLFSASASNFNPLPNKPWFLPVCSISLLKTLREKEKLLKGQKYVLNRVENIAGKDENAVFQRLL